MKKPGSRLKSRRITSRIGLLALIASAAAPGVARAQDYIQQLKPSVNEPGHNAFGSALAVDGTTLVVGDPEYQSTTNGCGTGYGAVDIYKLSGGVWTLNQTIKFDTAATVHNLFGNWISLRNNVLVISSQNEDYTPSDFDAAGVFFVYKRSSPTAQFVPLPVSKYFAPIPSDDESFTTFGGVVTNGTYIVAADTTINFPNPKIYFYRITGNTVGAPTTIPYPVAPNVPIANLYLTNTNALIVSTFGQFASTPIAYQLSGTTYTPINTASTGDGTSTMSPFMGGDGNTLVTLKLAPTGSFVQVLKFTTGGVASWQNVSLPLWYSGDNLSESETAAPIAVKENQGFFLGYNNQVGQNGGVYNFVTGFKYLSGTGQYYPAGVVRSDLLNYANTAFASGGLAYDGTYLFVGDPGQVWTANNGTCPPQASIGAVDVLRPLTTVPAGPSGSKKLQPWLGVSTAETMGGVVATNGTYVLAGSFQGDDAVSWTGEMTLFENITNQWQQVDHYIDAVEPAFISGTQNFGFSADIDGNVLAIGAPSAYAANSQVESGAAFASTTIFPVGPFLTEVDPPVGTPWGTFFGWSVAVTGTTLVVGGPGGADIGGTGLINRGSAFVYALTGGSWNQTQVLQPTLSAGNDDEGFGTAIDVSGNNLIVGIPSRNVGGVEAAGAVQIFTLSGGRWVSAATFNAPASLPDWSQFGNSVSIGASYAVAGTANAGTVVVYHLNGTTWMQDTVLPAGATNFGKAVALEGTRFAVGSPGEKRVYRYERINNVWQRTGTLTSTASPSSFGSSLDIKNSLLVIGDPSALTGTTTNASTGAAYTISITGF